jgi:hypothetical protein
MLFVAMVVAFFYMLYRIDQDRSNTFKLSGLVVDRHGQADKYAIAYILVLLVGSWAIWYEAGNGRLTEWLVSAVIYAFVLGAAFKTGAAVAEAIKGAKKPDNPPKE